MSSAKTALTRLALDALYYSGGYRLLPTAQAGTGIIFTLHHVRPTTSEPFAPNGILEITPEFLDRVLTIVRDAGFDFITLDELPERLGASTDSRFACFTLDDGYLDNYTHALPVFRSHQVPFHVYVTTGMPDGSAVLWWRLLEHVIREHEAVTLHFDADALQLPTASTRQKWQAWEQFYWTLRGRTQEQITATVARLIADYALDAPALSRAAAMSWEMITELARSDIATIGAHTVSHPFLSKLPTAALMDEIDKGRQLIAERTGLEPAHFAYPYGDRGSAGPREFEAARTLGFTTATTTRKGMIFPEHHEHLHALPRVSLNGDYQTERYLRVFLSGTPFALAQRFRRLDVT